MDVAAKVNAILVDLSGVKEFPADISLGRNPTGHQKGVRSLGLDSLDRILAATRLEEAFGIQISDDDFTRDEMNTPAGIVAYIEGRLAG